MNWRTIVVSLVMAYVGTGAVALQWMNCSNSDGTLKRVENEIWGTNIINWYYQGLVIANAIEKFDNKSKNHLSGDDLGDADQFTRNGDEHFLVNVTVSSKLENTGAPLRSFTQDSGTKKKKVAKHPVAKDWVVCDKHKDSAID